MKKDIEIAAQMYTVRQFTQTEEGIAESLGKIKEIGYTSVQISAFGAYRPEFVRDLLQENGLRAVVTHTPYERITGDTERVIEEHKIMQVPFVGLGYRRFSSLDETDAFLDEILPAARKIRDAGLRFAYHNHQWEFVRFHGVRPMDRILARTSPDEFALIADAYWLQYAGVSPQKFLRENAERIALVHFKDMCIDASEGTQRFAEIGAGNMDHDELVSVMRETGIGCAAVEQDDCYGEDPFACLRRSREYIQSRYGI